MRTRLVLATWSLALALAPAARADVVTLKNGNELRGRVLEETDEHVVLQTAGGKLTFPRRQVASVKRDEATTRDAAPPPERAPAPDPAPAPARGSLPQVRLTMTAADVEALQAAARRGDHEAAVRLGQVHEYGLAGLPVDRDQARDWYERPAKAGHPYGVTRLARVYEQTLRRPDLHGPMYVRAAELGDPFAKGWLAAARDGDRVEALRWYRQAAERGDDLGMMLCAKYYSMGFGTEKDPAESARWSWRAAEFGHPTMLVDVGYMHATGTGGVPVNAEEAVRWYRMAAVRGQRVGMRNLAFCLARGRGIAPDPVEALRWFREAASLGEEVAMTHLARLHERGEGGAEKDEAEAARLYRTALRRKHGPARAPLIALLERRPALREPADDELLANSSDDPWVEPE